MGRIPDETIQAIRDRIDLVDLIGRYVTLRQSGRSFKALCPFHSEKTPSFHVHAERQIFHCFGCGAGGNCFSFLMQHENLSFPEAVQALGQQCGIEVPEEAEGTPGTAERLRRANEVVQSLYRRALRGPEGKAARRYLAERRLSPEIVDRFGIGFAPKSWDAACRALQEAGLGTEVGAQAGLLAERERGGYYDRLRGRVTFPIRDVRGGIVAFGGRVLGADEQPKYLNSAESPIFRKRQAFYGFPDALEPIRRAGRAVVVEGYFDLLALHGAGVGEVLATCGTALTIEHARNLKRRAREVVLFFDADEAGQGAMERALGVLLAEGLRVRAVELPAGDDPDSFLRREGPEALRERIAGASPALEIVARHAISRGCTSPWEKADVVASVARLLALVADPVERGEFARRLALLSGTERRDVEAAVRRERRGGDASEVAEAPKERAPRRIGAEERCAERLALLLLERPEQARGLDPEEIAGLVQSAPWNRIVPALVQAARRGGAELSSLAAELGEGAGSTLLGLAARGDDEPLARAEPERLLADLIGRLRERRRAEERREVTRKLAEQPTTDVAVLLEEKQRQLEERRAALGLTPPRELAHP